MGVPVATIPTYPALVGAQVVVQDLHIYLRLKCLMAPMKMRRCSPNVSAAGVGHFLHASTAAGREGDAAWLKTRRMAATRTCPVQCLQFYFCNLGNPTDQLNIWLREFRDQQDQTGTLHFVDQIAGNLKDDSRFLDTEFQKCFISSFR